MITKDAAKILYESNWCLETDSVDEVLERIAVLAGAGAYELCVTNDSTKTLDSIRAKLVELEFDVEDYNGKRDIIMIEWGA